MAKVTIIDYGIGNILSVSRAFEYCGAEVILTEDPTILAEAEYLVLPGVGAFADGMKGLRERNLIQPIREYAAQNRPFLGICLGMQMMLETSEEFGEHEGLGLVPGKVVKISETSPRGTVHKIPHIGWNSLLLPVGREHWQNTMFDKVETGAAVYFVHSYTAVPKDPQHRLADTDYNGCLLSAAIQRENLYGCQFHPEKSGPVGLTMIKSFLTKMVTK